MARTQAGENGGALRALALAAVVIGLVAVTSAACVLSYSSVHDFALSAGIKPSLARIYPDIADAMLAMAGCSVLALRGAGLLSKVYAWLCFVVLLGALAATSAAHEAGLSMPRRAAEITAAIFPWAIVLAAFGLLLASLRYARRRRQTHRASSAPPALEPPALEPPALEPPALEPPALEAGESADYEAAQEYDAGAYDSAGEYQTSEPYEYVMLQPTSQYPPSSPDEPGEHDAAPGAAAEPGVVSPTVPLPRPAPEPDDTPEAQPLEAQPPTQPPRAIRPTEMQLRARTSRQPEPACTPAADQPGTEPTPPAGAPVTEPVTSGFTGDTIPRGELNPAPTPASPPELDRPRSSPTPPS